MSTAALDKLTKVLELERRQGCADTAVIGGLDDFLTRWRNELASDVPKSVLHRVLAPLGRYGDLSPAVRRARLDDALAVVRKGRGDPGARRPAGRKARPRRSGRGAPPVKKAPRPRPDFPIREADDPALEQPVTAVRGVGERALERLERLGLRTVRDMLEHWPRDYRDYAEVVPIGQAQAGDELTVVGTVSNVRATKGRGGRNVLWVLLDDTTGKLRLAFFNQPYLSKRFVRGRTIAASGRVEQWNGRPVMNSPEWEAVGQGQIHTARVLPIYPSTQGISQRWLRRHIDAAVQQWAPRLGEPLPEELRRREGLLAKSEAVWSVHLPRDLDELRQARKRLAFDELLGLQLWARQRRRARAGRRTASLSGGSQAMGDMIEALPWPLTNDQRAAIDTIAAELDRETPMSRHLQGDVGCGKTVVAAAAIVRCVGAGRQATLMAPTEILARQHARSLERLLQPVGWRSYRPVDPAATADPGGPVMALLVGGMPDAEKRSVRSALREGRVDAVVGTHALIQEGVELAAPGLAVIDEQHRFGVLQRAVLEGADEEVVRPEAAGPAVHSLIMTATPIPRTLAHVLNADLDMTVIAEMPRQQQLPETRWLREGQRERAYQFIRRRVVDREERAYIVYPLVEESEHVDARAAVTEFERLDAEVFPDVPMALVHGRMAPEEKEHAMAVFQRGEVRILVATTVIEVGVDVPEATIILIDGAERFGLAQLHQLRGRVGRGSRPGVCLLLSDAQAASTRQRLQAITEKVPDPEAPDGERLRNGLELSELDLKIRGPGDYFGTRQSGLIEQLHFARLGDGEVVAAAARVAEDVVDADPDLAEPRHRALRQLVAPFHRGAARK